MAKIQHTNNTTDVQPSDKPSPGASECHSGGMLGCGMGKKGLKGMLLMAACCGAPLLLLLVLPLMGSALGAVGVSALSTLAVLACPIGMALMMWMMMRGQRMGTPEQAQMQSAPQVTSMTQSQAAAVHQDVVESVDSTVIPASVSQEDGVTPLQHVNGQQTKRPVLVANGSQAAAPTAEQSHTQSAPSPQA